MSEFTVMPYVLGFLARVKDGQKQVLLMYRTNTSFGNGKYSLPGGKIDAGESPHQAIVREIREELGSTVLPEASILRTLLYFEGETRTCVAFLFSIEQWEGEPINNEPSKHDHIAWFNLNKLPDTILPRHARLIRQLQEGVLYDDEGFNTSS